MSERHCRVSPGSEAYQCELPQTVVDYYDGTRTTDWRRALTLRRREAVEAHAARMRDRCPRDADLIKVEETAAAD